MAMKIQNLRGNSKTNCILQTVLVQFNARDIETSISINRDNIFIVEKQ